MNLVVVIGLASIFVLLAFVGWNMSVPRRTLKPWVERLVTGSSVALAFLSLAEGAPLSLGMSGLLVSSALFALTFLSRLPQQRPAVAVGDAAPDFALYDSEYFARRLSDYAGDWVILKFYRGYWCPYCVRELHEWEAKLDELAARRVRVVAISPHRVHEIARVPAQDRSQNDAAGRSGEPGDSAI